MTAVVSVELAPRGPSLTTCAPRSPGWRPSLRTASWPAASLDDHGDVDLMAIGEAAGRLGLRPSALRYYDERGLVAPRAGRAADVRARRAAPARVPQDRAPPRHPLDTAAAVLGAPGPRWRSAVRDQIAELDRLVDQAQDAQRFLRHALDHRAHRGAAAAARGRRCGARLRGALGRWLHVRARVVRVLRGLAGLPRRHRDVFAVAFAVTFAAQALSGGVL